MTPYNRMNSSGKTSANSSAVAPRCRPDFKQRGRYSAVTIPATATGDRIEDVGEGLIDAATERRERGDQNDGENADDKRIFDCRRTEFSGPTMYSSCFHARLLKGLFHCDNRAHQCQHARLFCRPGHGDLQLSKPGREPHVNTYVFGDLQGCLEPFLRLLDAVRFDPASDRLWLVGDLVNRGPDSLPLLRALRGLDGQLRCVLGNHDLSTLALARGARTHTPHPSLKALLAAPDAGELLEWLRHRSLIHREDDIVMLHAGLPPQWTVAEAEAHARELETVLRSADCDDFLARMYGDEPRRWSPALSGTERLRFITNCLTRLRFCHADGSLVLDCKGPPGTQEEGALPWFAVPGRRSQDHTLLFGHWSALGPVFWPQHRVWALDTGYVWGRELTALHLETRRLLYAPARP